MRIKSVLFGRLFGRIKAHSPIKGKVGVSKMKLPKRTRSRVHPV